MHSEILFYTFIGIFILTAVLTLASLPGWIEIPDAYKKVLFSSLLLEVVGSVIILFKQEVFTTIEIDPMNDWAAISTTTGELINPALHFNDSIVVLGDPIPEAKDRMQSLEYRLVKNGNAFFVEGKDNEIAMGKIEQDGFDSTFLFNSIKTVGKEITGTNNYRIIKFNKNEANEWKKQGAFFSDSPLRVEVSDLNNQTIYKVITDSLGTIGYSSEIESEDVMNLNNRRLHFFDINHSFYMVRITEANLTAGRRKTMFINFMLIKLQPQLVLNQN